MRESWQRLDIVGVGTGIHRLVRMAWSQCREEESSHGGAAGYLCARSWHRSHRGPPSGDRCSGFEHRARR
jgi:hypothetical protein